MQVRRSVGLPHIVLVVSGIVFVMGSIGMSLRLEPFHSWYYLFAWWPYIFIMESFLEIRARTSLLYNNPKEFWILLPLSVTLWCIFEAYNIRLDNWHYLNLPSNPAVRWAGYFFSFATVLPAILVTTRLFDFLAMSQEVKAAPLKRPESLYQPLLFTGFLLLFLPLAFPRYYFPMVWAGFAFLLEPMLHRYGGRSLLGQWSRGSIRAFLLLLAAGLACGLLWECWNFWAGAKWYYTVSFVGDLKLFEMPILGFLGFPPFAVEIYVMANAFYLIRERLHSMAPHWHGALRIALIVLVVVFDLAVFHGIDAWTVTSFR